VNGRGTARGRPATLGASPAQTSREVELVDSRRKLAIVKKVFFICIHNSARSQIAEAMLNRLGAGHFAADSAGIEPGTLNPLAVAVLNEIGIDIAAKKTKRVVDVIQSGVKDNYVVTVCDETSAERCPAFPAETMRLH